MVWLCLPQTSKYLKTIDVLHFLGLEFGVRSCTPPIRRDKQGVSWALDGATGGRDTSNGSSKSTCRLGRCSLQEYGSLPSL